MSTWFRAIIGFVLGLLLSVVAFFLSGAGHGTYAPMAANVSVLIFIPTVGILLALFGTPFLWATYYALIPRLGSRTGRVIALGSVTLLHLIPGVWLAFEDSAFTRALGSSPSSLIIYGLVLVAALLGLAALSSFVKT